MNNRQARRYAQLVNLLFDPHRGYGIAEWDVDALIRIERALSRWATRECNGEVEIGADGKAYGVRRSDKGPEARWRVPNVRKCALRNLEKIMEQYPLLGVYLQPDPRGCALYVYRKDALKGGADISSCYSSVGVAVCY